MLRRPTTLLDGSACITGLLLGMNLPSNFPIWMIIVGALVAIGIGKMTFGGLGCNPFNPAIVGRCFLLVSFPAAMTSWPVAGQQMAYTDAVTGATPLSLMKTAIKTGDVSVLQGLPDTVDMLLGNVANGYGAGTIGEVCALALIAGLIWMLWRRVITWHIPITILDTGAYDRAAEAFSELGKYKDSPQKAEDAVHEQAYQKAQTLLDSEEYDQAAEAFKALGAFRSILRSAMTRRMATLAVRLMFHNPGINV